MLRSLTTRPPDPPRLRTPVENHTYSLPTVREIQRPVGLNAIGTSSW
jgi:hypothetical protein